jgi:hypothetical protein
VIAPIGLPEMVTTTPDFCMEAFRHPSFSGLSDTQVFRDTWRLSGAAYAVFLRRVLDKEERIDTFVHYCRCGHDQGRECPPLLQESH